MEDNEDLSSRHRTAWVKSSLTLVIPLNPTIMHTGETFHIMHITYQYTVMVYGM